MPSRQMTNLPGMSTIRLRDIPGQDQRLAAVPSLRTFVSEVEARLSGGSPTAFWDCEEPLRALLRGPFPQEVINYELSRLQQEHFYGPASSNNRQYVIYATRHSKLSLASINSSTPRLEKLQGLTRNAMVTALGANAITVKRYHSGEIDLSILDREAQLTQDGVQVLGPGEIGFLEAGRHVADISASKPTLLVSFLSGPVHEIAWEYDRATLKPVKAISDNLITSRVEHALGVIANLGDVTHVPILEELFEEHPAHFIRWAIVKAVVALDLERGKQMLQKATHDAHPHVQRAAQTSLARIEQSQADVAIA